MSCFIDHKSNEQEIAGLMNEHCYCITDKQQFVFETENFTGFVPLLRIRDPWISKIKWNGNWSIGSKMWSFLSESLKQTIGLTSSHKGDFWISLKDFIKYFDRLEICHLSPDNGNGKWSVRSHCFNFKNEQNSNFCLIKTTDSRNHLHEVVEQTDNKCTVMISIMQKVPVQIKISIYKVLVNERKRICHIIFNDNFHNCVRLKIPTGNYEITPEYTEPNESEQKFYLRIFTPTEIPIEEIDFQQQEVFVNLQHNKMVILVLSFVIYNETFLFFYRYFTQMI